MLIYVCAFFKESFKVGMVVLSFVSPFWSESFALQALLAVDCTSMVQVPRQDFVKIGLVRDSTGQHALRHPLSSQGMILGGGGSQRWALPLPECRGERILFCPSWRMRMIFREISCAQCPWKFKDQNLQSFRQYFALFFASVSKKKSPEFRSRGSRS